MEELWNQTPKDIFDTNTVSSVSDQLEQDYRRYAHKLDEEVIVDSFSWFRDAGLRRTETNNQRRRRVFGKTMYGDISKAGSIV